MPLIGFSSKHRISRQLVKMPLPKKGDIIRFPRLGYSHFAIYIEFTKEMLQEAAAVIAPSPVGRSVDNPDVTYDIEFDPNARRGSRLLEFGSTANADGGTVCELEETKACTVGIVLEEDRQNTTERNKDGETTSHHQRDLEEQLPLDTITWCHESILKAENKDTDKEQQPSTTIGENDTEYHQIPDTKNQEQTSETNRGNPEEIELPQKGENKIVPLSNTSETLATKRREENNVGKNKDARLLSSDTSELHKSVGHSFQIKEQEEQSSLMPNKEEKQSLQTANKEEQQLLPMSNKKKQQSLQASNKEEQQSLKLSNKEEQQSLQMSKKEEQQSVQVSNKEQTLQETNKEEQLLQMSYKEEQLLPVPNEEKEQLVQVSNKKEQSLPLPNEEEEQLIQVSNKEDQSLLVPNEEEEQLVQVSNKEEQSLAVPNEEKEHLIQVSNKQKQLLKVSNKELTQAFQVQNEEEQSLLVPNEEEEQLVQVSNKEEQSLPESIKDVKQLLQVSMSSKCEDYRAGQTKYFSQSWW